LGVVIMVVLGFALGSLCDPVLNHTDIYVRGDGFQCYRVPALLVSSKGTILAFAEARNGTTTPVSCVTDNGETHKSLALKRSFDNGATWGPLQVIGSTECGGGFECGYEAVLQDSSTGTIFVTYGGKPGIQISQSSDDGKTWSPFVPLPHFPSLTSTSPGHGLQIDGSLCGGNAGPECPAGRLVFPAECTVDSVPHSCAVFSDDHGKTWVLSSGDAQSYSRENEFVQVPSLQGNALLYSNQRNFGASKGVRLISWSYNGASNFTKFTQDNSLIEPVTPSWTGIVASVARLSLTPSRILFSDPNCPNARTNMTIKISHDEGMSWNSGKVLDPGPSSYSDLARLSDTQACILYERGAEIEMYEKITFVAFNLSWLEN